jgi:tetratricopeptide (TPR) repeat protein
MAEHRSYFPSIGIFLALACGADWLRTRWTTRPAPWNLLVPGGMTLWVGALGAATVARNQVWSSEIAMWKDAANKSPNKPRVWTNLGSSYARQRLFNEAHAAYKEQLRLAPRQMIGYLNLAAIEVELGRYKEAIETATAGTRVPATIYEERLYYVLGRAWLALGDVEKSIDCAVRVVTLAPRHAGAHRTLMELYFRTARFDKSLEHGLIAASLIPEDKHLAADILTIRRAIARQNAR